MRFVFVVAGEGFELMLRCLREKKHAAWCAVKVLDFALSDNDLNCQRYTDTHSCTYVGRDGKDMYCYYLQYR